MQTLNIALPKGRLGEKVYKMLDELGFGSREMTKDSRKLIFESKNGAVRFFWVKPSDVGIYVERGAADIGVAGKDILREYSPDVYELADLGFGKCRMCVAGRIGVDPECDRVLRVATKFPNIAREYYASRGRDIDIIKLSGSIELAPILSLSDVIVDIVETGSTLRENFLEVKETVCDISARLIANRASYRFKNAEITELCAKIKEKTGEKNDKDI